MLPYTDAEHVRFAQLAEVYLVCRAALRDVLEATQAHPGANSGAGADIAALLAREPPVPDGYEWLITKTTQLCLYAGGEHLGGLAALYLAEEVLLSPLVLARSAVEQFAHVRWIIGESSETAEDRLARAFLEEIESAEHVKKNAELRFGTGSEEHQRRTTIYRALKEDAAAMFDPPLHNARGRPQLRGHVLPGPTEIVLEMNRASSRSLPDDVVEGSTGCSRTMSTRLSTRSTNCSPPSKTTES